MSDAERCSATRNNLECRLPAGHTGHHCSFEMAWWGWAGTDNAVEQEADYALGEIVEITVRDGTT